MPHEEFGYDIPAAERPSFLARLVRLNRYLLALLIIPAGVLYFRPPLKEQEAARQRLAAVTEQHQVLEAEAARLKQRLDLIKSDPDYLETMARDRLRMQKDGEIIVRFGTP